MNDQSILKAVKLLESLTAEERQLVIRLTKPKAAGAPKQPVVKRRRRRALGSAIPPVAGEPAA